MYTIYKKSWDVSRQNNVSWAFSVKGIFCKASVLSHELQISLVAWIYTFSDKPCCYYLTSYDVMSYDVPFVKNHFYRVFSLLSSFCIILLMLMFHAHVVSATISKMRKTVNPMKFKQVWNSNHWTSHEEMFRINWILFCIKHMSILA